MIGGFWRGKSEVPDGGTWERWEARRRKWSARQRRVSNRVAVRFLVAQAYGNGQAGIAPSISAIRRIVWRSASVILR